MGSKFAILMAILLALCCIAGQPETRGSKRARQATRSDEEPEGSVNKRSAVSSSISREKAQPSEPQLQVKPDEQQRAEELQKVIEDAHSQYIKMGTSVVEAEKVHSETRRRLAKLGLGEDQIQELTDKIAGRILDAATKAAAEGASKQLAESAYTKIQQ